ncbi:MAG TPA: amidohydrolase [Candidatus Acidoferrum sp.]|jgi:hippurate hydrolase|nr:amidohydrolase [Candidatus Acidoferrum sp.]
MHRFTKNALLLLIISLCGSAPLLAQSDLDQRVGKEMDSLVATYKHLHENPELSTQEKESSAIVAGELRKLGYDVTDHFGLFEQPGLTGYGVVGVLRNGPGPTVYVRTDMDALPIVENTGLPYASHVKVKRADGTEVAVMHACGHDIHMSVFIGTARMLAQLRNQWSGTLILIGQPAEEMISGAHAMLRAGLFSKFPKPDYVLALHDGSDLPAGKVSWHEGTITSGADSVDITVRGKGGHGAAPQASKDPIVIASEIVVALQTIVSREMDPQLPTVVTVGSFHAGTKHNIIPDEAHLQLTVRTMNPQQREKVLGAITRIANGIAAAAGVPADRAPIVELGSDKVPATINDPLLTRRVAAALELSLGKENVLPGQQSMASEDFSLYALEDPKPPICMFHLGAADPAKFKEAQEKGMHLPGPHSSEFAPLPEPTIRTGVKAMTAAVLDLMKK